MQIGDQADVALSTKALADLKAMAKENPQQNAAAVAHQFESLLVGLVLKESHKDNLGGKLFENHATELAQELLDQEIGLHVAQKANLGFERFLTQGIAQREPGHSSLQAASHFLHPLDRGIHAVEMPQSAKGAISAQRVGSNLFEGQPWSREAFVAALQAPIASVAARLGVDSHALMAQAALESGWGRRILQLPDGQSSFNVFNIKADKSWPGPAVEAASVEEEGGIAVLRTSRFRVYGSLQEGIADYANFLDRNPRYQEALRQRDAAGYITALAQAGYATDGQYASKVLDVMEHPVIRSVPATAPATVS
jgi:flagellar protein FlgJ